MITDYAPRLDHRRTRARRRRSLALGAIVALGGLGLFGKVAYGGSAAPDRVVVNRGDSLWSIAARHYPGDDLQSRIAEIITTNHLNGADLSPGETLTLPAD